MSVNQPTLILASGSRYRAELLARLTINFESIAPDVDESHHADEHPKERSQRLAIAKATKLASSHPNAIIIGSDQVASTGPLIFDKPGSEANAVSTLLSLRGETVDFFTSVCVLSSLPEGQLTQATRSTQATQPAQATQTIQATQAAPATRTTHSTQATQATQAAQTTQTTHPTQAAQATNSIQAAVATQTTNSTQATKTTQASQTTQATHLIQTIQALAAENEHKNAIHHTDHTQVQVREDLTAADIERYVRADKPFDCAGGFKVESLGISLFDSVTSSDPTALIGLPLITVSRALRHFGLSVP